MADVTREGHLPPTPRGFLLRGPPTVPGPPSVTWLFFTHLSNPSAL